MEELHRQIVDLFLFPAWRGIDSNYKSNYRSSIWQQFEDNIKSAAYTSQMGRFAENLVRKMGIGFRAEDVAAVNAFLALPAKPVLKAMRDEPTMLVLMTRLKNEAFNEERGYPRKEKKDEDLPVRDDANGSLFDQP